jgi:hypothetical protein
MSELNYSAVASMKQMTRTVFGAVALMLLVSCSFVPTYERPAAPWFPGANIFPTRRCIG